MRGDSERQANILLAVTPEAFVPKSHLLRRIKPLVDECLERLSPRFDEMYARRGRPSIPPEHLLKGSLLIALFSVRSERQFCEQLRYNLEVAPAFFSEVVAEARRRRLLSDDRFSVDGTLLEAWASLKSYRPRDEQEPPARSGGHNAEVDATLGSVSLLRFSPLDVPAVAFNRLNEHYRDVVELSRLILRYRAIEVDRGGVRANGFLMDINEVFQGFVTRALRESLGVSDRTLRSDKNLPGTLWLDKGRRVPLKPDVSWWDGSTCTFVGELARTVRTLRDDARRLRNAA